MPQRWSFRAAGFLTLIGALILSGTLTAWGTGEISIQEVTLENTAPNRYLLNAVVTNHTLDRREVILRSQVEVFDKAVPRGDLPLEVLRKDKEIILNPQETRPLEFRFVGEGTPPRGSLRAEPKVRIRRQRVWQYGSETQE